MCQMVFLCIQEKLDEERVDEVDLVMVDSVEVERPVSLQVGFFENLYV